MACSGGVTSSRLLTPTSGKEDASTTQKLLDVTFQQLRSSLTSATIYFGILCLVNTLISLDMQGRIVGTQYSILTDIAKDHPVLFQVFFLFNVLLFTISSGSLCILEIKGKLKSKAMFMTVSTIASLCMRLSLVVAVFVVVVAALKEI